MKRPQGPIEIPPSVQNPQEGRSRSLKVTFQRGKSKKKRWEKRAGRTRWGSRTSRSYTGLRNVTDLKGQGFDHSVCFHEASRQMVSSLQHLAPGCLAPSGENVNITVNQTKAHNIGSFKMVPQSDMYPAQNCLQSQCVTTIHPFTPHVLSNWG